MTERHKKRLGIRRAYRVYINLVLGTFSKNNIFLNKKQNT